MCNKYLPSLQSPHPRKICSLGVLKNLLTRRAVALVVVAVAVPSPPSPKPAPLPCCSPSLPPSHNLPQADLKHGHPRPLPPRLGARQVRLAPPPPRLLSTPASPLYLLSHARPRPLPSPPNISDTTHRPAAASRKAVVVRATVVSRAARRHSEKREVAVSSLSFLWRSRRGPHTLLSFSRARPRAPQQGRNPGSPMARRHGT